MPPPSASSKRRASKRKASPVVEETPPPASNRPRLTVTPEPEQEQPDPDLEEFLDEYFEDDLLPFKAILIDELVREFQLSPSALDSVLERALRKRTQLTDEYCKSQPADQLWKLGLDSTVVARIEPVLARIRASIRTEEPTIQKIVEAYLPHEDRVSALEWFDVLQNTEPYTEDWLRYRATIKGILAKAASTQVAMLRRSQMDRELTALAAKPLSYPEQIYSLNASNEVKARIYERYRAMEGLTSDSKDFDSHKAWLDHALALPYDNVVSTERPTAPADINALCVRVKTALDNEVYGLDHVKQEFLSFMVNRLTNASGSELYLALNGPPGVGKSLLLSTVATAMGLPFERIALGGMTDSATLKGHDSTYMGAQPGLIVQILRRIKVSNGVVLLDEIDKLGKTEQGRQVQYALLHLADATTNKTFRDTYLSTIDIDLSRTMFVVAMNDKSWLDKAMLDRLYVIDLPSYKRKEKEEMLRTKLWPKAFTAVGFQKGDIELHTEAVTTLVRLAGEEENVRPLEKLVKVLANRLNLLRSVTLADGTTGALKLSYKVPNFRLPYTVTIDTIKRLELDAPKEEEDLGKLMMYL